MTSIICSFDLYQFWMTDIIMQSFGGAKYFDKVMTMCNLASYSVAITTIFKGYFFFGNVAVL